MIFALFLPLLATSAFAIPITPESAMKLRELRTQIRTWAPLCSDGTLTTDGRKDAHGTPIGCPQGDMLEFSGILCLSGESDRCEDVKRSQDDTGKFWRNPGVKSTPGQRHTFSRDMGNGALAYLIATRDLTAAEKWLDAIEKMGNRLCDKAPHTESCEPRAGFWSKARSVWRYLGLKPNKKMSRLKMWIERYYNPIEVEFQPHDYPMQLSAEAVYFTQELKKRGASVQNEHSQQAIARTLNRREPHNPFFRYLSEGADETGAQLIMKYCPAQQPSYATVGPDWIFQRGENTIRDHEKERTWTSPSGWECIFVINLLVGSETH